MDLWASKHPKIEVFAQIGDAQYIPTSLEWVRSLEPVAFDQHFDAADAIVAHAGMGTILGALHRGKPILVMPRLAHLREQRNDHQAATVKRFDGRPGVLVAHDETELSDQLDQLLTAQAEEPIGQYASPELLTAISNFLQLDSTSADNNLTATNQAHSAESANGTS